MINEFMYSFYNYFFPKLVTLKMNTKVLVQINVRTNLIDKGEVEIIYSFLSSGLIYLSFEYFLRDIKESDYE